MDALLVKSRGPLMYGKLFLILGASLGFPLFFTTSLSIFKGDATSYEFSIPIGFFVTFVCFVFFGWRSIASLSSSGPVLLLTGMSVTALATVFQIGSGDWALFFVYYGPFIFGFLLAWVVKIKSDVHVISIQIGFACAVTLGAILHLISSFISYGIVGSFAVRGEDSIFGLFSIYQKYIYFATILAFGFLFVRLLFKGFPRILASLILVVDILMTGSREALLLCVFFHLMVEFRRIGNSIQLLRFFIYFFSIIGLFIILALKFLSNSVDDFVFMAKLISIAESKDFNSLSAGRASVISDVFGSFDVDAIFVFFGSGFGVDIGELGTPHNQYVEWFLRGGLIFAFTNIAILCWSIYRHFRIGGNAHYLSGVVLLSVLLISNNINTPFRVPYTSVFLWFLIGLSFVPYRSYSRTGKVFGINVAGNRF